MRQRSLWCLLAAILAIRGWACPNGCNQHGTCLGLVCSCDNGFRGPDCSERVCPGAIAWADVASATDTAHAKRTECSNRGLCDRATGVCRCMAGFEGLACERASCPGHGRCNGHGRCMTLAEVAATQDDVEFMRTTTYTSVWDAHKLTGCRCDAGYAGYDCSQRTCPAADNPLTTGQVDEKQVVTCSCVSCSGTFTLKFRGETTAAIAHDVAATGTVKAALEALGTIGTVDVTFSGGAVAVCGNAGNVVTITFLTEPGDVPPLVAATSTGDLTVTVQSAGTDGGGLSQTGTKESVECGGWGFCDRATGICACHGNFASSNGQGAAGMRGDCGNEETSVSACPVSEDTTNTLPCSGHGTCAGASTYACTCFYGWTGHACDRRTCPSARAWFDEATGTDTAHAEHVECANRGTCDRATGLCRCMAGYTGGACQRMECPGKRGGSSRECAGHGHCMTMSELARHRVDGATGAPSPVVYGSVANVMATWDRHAVQACLCDARGHEFPLGVSGDLPDFTGFDCSLRTCPVGPRPTDAASCNTVFEQQTIVCTGSSGTFTLAFRGVASSAIAYDAPATGIGSVQQALQLLSTIGDVDVAYSSGAAACTAGGSNTITVTFKTELDDLPALVAAPSSPGPSGVVITDDVVQGTKTSHECADMGLCDRGTGQCKCFSGWTSGDGNGNRGSRGDCGKATAL